jgi:hypothetical protein
MLRSARSRCHGARRQNTKPGAKPRSQLLEEFADRPPHELQDLYDSAKTDGTLARKLKTTVRTLRRALAAKGVTLRPTLKEFQALPAEKQRELLKEAASIGALARQLQTRPTYVVRVFMQPD